MKTLIVIPVFNQAKTLRDVVIRTLDICKDILVVDDGSTDNPMETLAELKVRMIRHPVNSGKGSAILSALGEAIRLGMTHMVTLDADGQHDPRDVLRLIPVMQANPGAVVVGKRIFQGEDVPTISRFGRAFSNFWFRIQTGQAIQDTQSGFRAYPVAVLNRLTLHERHFSFEIEVLVKAAWAGVPLKEVDVSVYYPPMADRVSHFRPFMDNARMTILNTRLTIRSFIPWPHRKIFKEGQAENRITWFRPVESLRFLLKEELLPSTLALSGALGVFLGTLPLIALHTIAILFASGFFRLNKITALAASQLCIPPFVPALSIEIGYYIRHGKLLTEISFKTLGRQGLERIFEWVIGSMLLAPILALITGILIYFSALFLARKINAVHE